MSAAPHDGSSGEALARIEAALAAHGCGPTKTAGFWRCPVPEHGKGRGDRNPSLAVGQGREGATLYCKAGCAAGAILGAIGLDFASAFDLPKAKRERTRSAARPKRPSASQSATRETTHELEVIGPPTAEQIATLIRGRRITNPDTLARVGAQHVRARFRDADSGEWRGWGDYLGLPALGASWMLYAIHGDGGEWLDEDGKLRRFSAGPCSLIVSPDLRERNGASLERLYDLEGAPDLLAWVDAGGAAALASTGGAGALGGHDAHAAKLRALEPAEVVVLRDLDDAGRKGAAKAADWYLHRGVAVRVVTLPDALGDGGDVRDYLTGRDGGEPLGGVADLDALVDTTELRTPGTDTTDDREPERDADGPRVVSLATVRAEVVEWLWAGRVPLSKLTVLDGDPGLGKSLVTLDLAARVSTGRAMPDGTRGIDGGAGVVLLSAEDGLGDTIRPRLDAAGADLARVVALQGIRTDGDERMPEMPADTEWIAQVVCATSARLVIVDPLMAYLAGEVNANRDHDVRRALAPLAAMAERTGAAVLVVRHLNKGGASSANPVYRGGGSIGIIGAARSGLLVARDPDDQERRVLAVTKSNLAAPVPGLGFRVAALERGLTVEWLGASEHSAASLLAEPDGDARTARDEAAAWLGELLRAGPVAATEVRKRAKIDGIADRTLDRAKARLGARAFRSGFGAAGIWVWELKAATSPPITDRGAL